MHARIRIGKQAARSSMHRLARCASVRCGGAADTSSLATYQAMSPNNTRRMIFWRQFLNWNTKALLFFLLRTLHSRVMRNLDWTSLSNAQYATQRVMTLTASSLTFGTAISSSPDLVELITSSHGSPVWSKLQSSGNSVAGSTTFYLGLISRDLLTSELG